MALALPAWVLVASLACVHWASQGPDPDEIAAARAWAIADSGSEAGQRAQCELAASLTRLGFTLAARHVLLEIAGAGPGHRCFAEAAGELLDGAGAPPGSVLLSDLVERLGSRPFSRFSPERFYQVNLLLGEAALRAGRWAEARRILGDDWSIPPGSLSYARAQYLLGTMASSSGWPGGPSEVPAFFGRARQGAAPDDALGELAVLGLARASRGLGDEREASALYQQIPRASPWWAQAQLELAWALLLQGDAAGALGAVALLRPSERPAAFLPEAPLLEAAILLQSCLYAEAERALEPFERIWRPLPLVLEQMMARARHPGAALALLGDRNLPMPVRGLLDSSPRLTSLVQAIQASSEEESRFESVAAFREGPAAGFARGLGVDRARLAVEIASVAQRRFAEAARRIERLGPAVGELRRMVRAQLTRAHASTPPAAKPEGQSEAPVVASWPSSGSYWADEVGPYPMPSEREGELRPPSGCRASAMESDRRVLVASASPRAIPAAVSPDRPPRTSAPDGLAQVLQVVAEAVAGLPEEP